MKKIFLCICLLLFIVSLNCFSQIKTKAKLTVNNPDFYEIVPENGEIEKLAYGFRFTEGPAWSNQGYVIFSDIPANRIFKWKEGEGISVFRENAGLNAENAKDSLRTPGTNGLAFNSKGYLYACEHGNRRITLTDNDDNISVLTDNFEGKKYNSPNDLVVLPNGSFFFSDPPYGLKGMDNSLAKEIKYNGVFYYQNKKVTLIDSSLTMPNGMALSTDFKKLYVANSDPGNKFWKVYMLKKDGTVKKSKVFFDANNLHGDGSPDGMKIDQEGNLYCTGPGGILVISEKGEHLGTIGFPETPSNCCFGDADKKTLYVTARTGIYRIKLKKPGIITY